VQGLSTVIEQGVKNVQKLLGKKAKQSSNQGPPDLTPNTLTTQPLSPLLHTVLYFCVKMYINKILEYSRRFYECSIRSLEKCVFY